jgi:hypothetical protein
MRAVRLPAVMLLAAVVAVGGIASAVAANASSTVAATHVYNTEVVNVGAPAEHDSYSPFKITGQVKAKTGTKWAGAGSVSVTIYYRWGPKVSWHKIGTATTTGGGAFSWRHTMNAYGRKQWQLRVAKQQIGTTSYDASTSAIRSTLFGATTSISGVSEHALGGNATLVTAILNSDLEPLTVNAYGGPVRGAAKFYYLPAGKKSWIYEGSDSTDIGSVLFIYSSAKGRIRIIFPSQGDYLGSSVTAPIG